MRPKHIVLCLLMFCTATLLFAGGTEESTGTTTEATTAAGTGESGIKYWATIDLYTKDTGNAISVLGRTRLEGRFSGRGGYQTGFI